MSISTAEQDELEKIIHAEGILRDTINEALHEFLRTTGCTIRHIELVNKRNRQTVNVESLLPETWQERNET